MKQIPSTGPSFGEELRQNGLGSLKRAHLTELQVNVGKLCNQACSHCHVDAGPKRTEIMTPEIMARIVAWLEDAGIAHVDITGGAPELNPGFHRFVDDILQAGARVTSRCNLTVLFEPGQEDLAQWYADRQVRLVCSLPCYSRRNVDAQRGKGVFGKSIEALKALNEVGYSSDPELVLDLVYNPGGASLPPCQESLQEEYRERLWEDFGIRFNNLFTLANLPINRFAHFLERQGKAEEYQHLLIDNFNPDTVNGLMCRHIISVDWEGRVYDCDFNQMLELPMGMNGVQYLWDIDSRELADQPIRVDRHCFGCTAGAGSSCGGALT
ncbi:MAG: arsenosugar biosynthesis radical SAM (seleno)protein ArsS [Gammaproteobacteria bacterium]|nr:arsenosugar biosynthesis radical SAM (seleno)protein ArsS [Gammaproteobacteria bacterium]